MKEGIAPLKLIHISSEGLSLILILQSQAIRQVVNQTTTMHRHQDEKLCSQSRLKKQIKETYFNLGDERFFNAKRALEYPRQNKMENPSNGPAAKLPALL